MHTKELRVLMPQLRERVGRAGTQGFGQVLEPGRLGQGTAERAALFARSSVDWGPNQSTSRDYAGKGVRRDIL